MIGNHVGANLVGSVVTVAHAQQVVKEFSKQKDYKLQFLVNVMKARLMSVCWKNDALALVFTIKCA